MTEFDVEAIDLTVLRDRQSIKYRAYGADVIPAWIAEMDFPLAEPIARALHDAIDRSDTGYPSGTGLRMAHSTPDRTSGTPMTRAAGTSHCQVRAANSEKASRSPVPDG